MSFGNLAESTRTGKLRHVEALYAHADDLLGPGGLDDALSRQDDAALASALESWFISLRNRAAPTRSDEHRMERVVTNQKPPRPFASSFSELCETLCAPAHVGPSRKVFEFVDLRYEEC